MTTKKTKTHAIKLDQTSDTVHEKDTWHGVGPFKVTLLDDDAIQFDAGDQEPQRATPKENKYGKYYIVNLFDGVAFVSYYKPKNTKFDPYYRIALGQDCVLPDTVVTSMSKGSSGGGAKTGAKKTKGATAKPAW